LLFGFQWFLVFFGNSRGLCVSRISSKYLTARVRPLPFPVLSQFVLFVTIKTPPAEPGYSFPTSPPFSSYMPVAFKQLRLSFPSHRESNCTEASCGTNSTRTAAMYTAQAPSYGNCSAFPFGDRLVFAWRPSFDGVCLFFFFNTRDLRRCRTFFSRTPGQAVFFPVQQAVFVSNAFLPSCRTHP